MFAATKTAAAAAGAPPSSNDPQFNYVTMLLHGDGTNGAQNNTFVDSSTNNFTITRNGTPTQGSFSPYGTLWSNYFGGSQFLTAPSNAAFGFGTGDFTIETWAYFAGVSTQQNFIDLRASAGGTAPILYITATGVVNYSVGGAALISSASNAVPANTWNHIALSRSSGSSKIFVNGTQVGSTAADSTNFGTTIAAIGGVFNSTNTMTGYLSNVRIVKGTAVYTSAFTPSTTPLTAVSGTSLLTCQSNRFIDNSSNNFAITVTGTPSVQRFSPFEPSTGYDTSVIGGSGYLNGTSDYFGIPSNSAFTFGTGDFTFEAWVYHSVASTLEVYIDQTTNGFSFSRSSANKLQLAQAGVAVLLTSTSNLVINQWNHVAVTRSGTTARIFINGSLDASGTVSTNFSQTTTSTIGRLFGSGANYLNGYISNVRIVKGTAVYTAAFTPPTAPLTAITNTSLLLNCVNAGIYDNAMMNDLVTVGDAQVSTSVKKYGTGSLAFDGTGDCLTTPDVGLFDFGTGDFTVESWIYPTAFITDGNSIASGLGPNDGDWMMALRSSTQLSWGRNHLAWDVTTSGVTFSLNTWYHVAVTKSSGTLRIFVDGVQRASASNSQSYTVQNSLAVGARQLTRYVFGPGEFFNGYIDDLRITKGVARYTANFTPPTAPFPNN